VFEMPRGGARIGAGRPKGSTKAQLAARASAGVVAPAQVLRAEAKAGRAARAKSIDPKVKPPKKPVAGKFEAGTPPTAAGVKSGTPPGAAPVQEPTETTIPESASTEQQVPVQPVVIKTPLQHLFDRMNDPTVPAERRDTLAIALAPYMHPKTGEIGKKDLAQQAAENVSTGKFATAAPPKLSVVSRQ
jgi:hypothetical protein